MAQAVRDIRRRIKAIRNTQQITKAMQMVAAARLRKAQTRALTSRAYAGKLSEVLDHLTADGAHADQPLLAVRPVRRAALILMSADRGLAGSYNANLMRRMEAILDQYRRGTDEGPPVEVELSVLGRKGRDYFRRRGPVPAHEALGVADDELEGLARELAHSWMRRFQDGAVDEVVVVYSRFVSALQQKPEQLRLLPVADPGGGSVTEGVHAAGEVEAESEGSGREPSEADLRYIYQPDPKTVYALLLPKFVINQLYQSLLEGRASEHAARMAAMANATENAQELIGRLTLEMNRARQASITQEIMELVGGAEALRKG